MTLWRVRRLLDADLPAVRGLHLACLAQAEWLPALARRLAPAEYEHAALGPQELGWVVQDGPGNCLGFMAVQPQARFIRNLFVRADARGQGVGRALLDALPVLPPESHWQLKCVKANVEALRFYERLSWRVVGEGVSGDGPWFLMASPPGHP